MDGGRGRAGCGIASSVALGMRRRLCAARTLSQQAESRPEPALRQPKESTERTEGLLAQLRSRGLEVIDDRSGGGHFWVVGGKELYHLLGPKGFIWGPRGAPATGNRAGWYL